MSNVTFADNQPILDSIRCSKCRNPVLYHIQTIPCNHLLCEQCAKLIDPERCQCPCCYFALDSLSKSKKVTEILYSCEYKCKQCFQQLQLENIAVHCCKKSFRVTKSSHRLVETPGELRPHYQYTFELKNPRYKLVC